MPVEHSAGAVVFRRTPDQILYLLLHYEEGHWGSSKGHIEKGESIEQTVRREVREETGINDLQLAPGFKTTDRYFFVAAGQRIFKTVVFLLAEAHTEKVLLSDEHVDFAWLPYVEARSKITFKNEQDILQKAHVFLSNSVR